MSGPARPPVAAHAGAADRPMAEVLRLVSRELAAMAWVADDIQRAAGEIARAGGVSRENWQALQRLDLLTQVLTDLTGLTHVIADLAPDAGLPCDALARKVVLADLRQRLLGAADRDGPPMETGEVALF